MTNRQYKMVCALKARPGDPAAWLAAREIERLTQVLDDIRTKILESERAPG